MDGRTAKQSVENSKNRSDEARAARLKERLEALLREAASVEVELSRADGSIVGVPHYSVIENRAHELGQQLSRRVQQQQMNELAAGAEQTAPCPACKTRWPVKIKKRRIKSVVGALELCETVAHCNRCRRDFFPSPGDVGI